jgi:SAM-dependent methyltransferase
MNALTAAVGLWVWNDWREKQDVHESATPLPQAFRVVTMIAKSPLEPRFREWNKTWKAPYGSATARNRLPKGLWTTALGARAVGMFAFQPNNSARRFEYPWAFFESATQPGMKVLDIGGGVSGFPFVLGKAGAEATIVDPFFEYGGPTDYTKDPDDLVSLLNSAFATNVALNRNTIDQAGLPSDTFDRIFCISALEHFPADARAAVAREVPRLLKPGGRFIATVDLFLNLHPFTSRPTNAFGSNVSIRDLVERSGLRLVAGDRAELVGYDEFSADAVLSRLETYHVATPYPALTQAFVLER